jgi:hypothetical protein
LSDWLKSRKTFLGNKKTDCRIFKAYTLTFLKATLKNNNNSFMLKFYCHP